MISQVKEQRETKEVFEDFANILNMSNDTITEFSFAEAGGSKFNKAIYHNSVTPNLLQELVQKPCNVSFLADCSKDLIHANIGSPVFRQATNKCIKQKRIISFDIDFKDIFKNKEFTDKPGNFSFALALGGKIIDLAKKNSLPMWLLNFSGNGLHVHFKLSSPWIVNDDKEYSSCYNHWVDILELIFGQELVFDRSCSNVARLMRLPLSTNWKDKSHPVKNVILHHDVNADGSKFFAELSQRENNEGSLSKAKRFHTLEQILRYFNYQKLNSIKEVGNQIVCSSPFSDDDSPSFYFHPERQIYYDFSTGTGGTTRTLVSKLSQENKIASEVCFRDLTISSSTPVSHAAGANRYACDEDGVWFSKPTDNDADALWICSSLTVKAMTRDQSNSFWGRVLSYKDQDGVSKTWAMPMEMLAGDGLELRKELLKRGLQISTDRRARQHLMSYIQSCDVAERIRCIDRIGWHKDTFVLPNRIFSKSGDDSVILQKEGDFSAFQTSGTLEDWIKNVVLPCEGNSRLIFALSIAFAPPLLKIIGEESGGVHMVGPSSIGKTLCLRIAASVWGGGDVFGFIKKWRSTVNGLENLAESRCDSLLVLDEIAEIPAKDAATATYMLANGCGKKRLDRNGDSKPVSEWRILFLSSGEVGLANHLAEAGEQHRGGQFVRLVEIDADAGKGLGVFDQIGSYQSSSILADTLRSSCSNFYGTAIQAFLEQLVKRSSSEIAIRSYVEEFLASLNPQPTSGQQIRVAKRFALIYAAGALAVDANILPFGSDDIKDAISTCYMSWASSNIGSSDFETGKILSQVRQYLQSNSCSQFFELENKLDIPFRGKCSGFKMKNEHGEIEWLVLNEIFRNEVCRGLDFRKVIRVLTRLNIIKQDKTGKSSLPMRLPELGLVRVYHLGANIFEDGEQSS
jgi:putative DNA primase/helicase